MLETEVIVRRKRCELGYRVSIRRYIGWIGEITLFGDFAKEFLEKILSINENEDYELLRSMIGDLPLKEATL